MTKYTIFDVSDQFNSRYWVGSYEDGEFSRRIYTEEGLFDFVRNNPDGIYLYQKPNEKLEGIIRKTRLENPEEIKQKLKLAEH